MVNITALPTMDVVWFCVPNLLTCHCANLPSARACHPCSHTPPTCLLGTCRQHLLCDIQPGCPSLCYCVSLSSFTGLLCSVSYCLPAWVQGSVRQTTSFHGWCGRWWAGGMACLLTRVCRLMVVMCSGRCSAFVVVVACTSLVVMGALYRLDCHCRLFD